MPAPTLRRALLSAGTLVGALAGPRRRAFPDRLIVAGVGDVVGALLAVLVVHLLRQRPARLGAQVAQLVGLAKQVAAPSVRRL